MGGLLGWSWLVPPYQWTFGAVCVTEVRAIEFSAPAVRDRCAADPALGYELTRRLFRCSRGGLEDTGPELIARGEDAAGTPVVTDSDPGGAAPLRCGTASAALPLCRPSSLPPPSPPSGRRLLKPDTAAGELGRDDPDEQVVLSGGPRPQVAVLAQVPQLARLQDPVRVAANQHAPALAELQVEMVGLEGDRAVAVPGDQRPRAGPDHDGAVRHRVVHRQDHQSGGGAEGDPADPPRARGAGGTRPG